jgi:hypothetical protein
MRRLTGQEQLTRSSPVGQDVFTVISVFKTKATLDDCDWNGHLSNSSYAKVQFGLISYYPICHLNY